MFPKPAQRALPVASAIVLLLTVLTSIHPAGAAQSTYFVNCNGGSDSNAGTSTSQPWKSLAPVTAHSFQAGSTIQLARGCTFDGGVAISGNGSAQGRITLTAFGTGAAPVVRNTSGGQQSPAIEVKAPYTTVENLRIDKAPQAGVNVRAPYALIRNLTISGTGFGVYVDEPGHDTKVVRVRARDLHIVNNTPGGDDDYGAVGFVFAAHNGELAASSCINCSAPSYDYGNDGGFVEIWQASDNLYIHNNFAFNTNGFFETGGSGGSHANNVRIVDNIIKNAGNLHCLHMDGGFALPMSNLLIEHNTLYQEGNLTLASCGGGSIVTLRNNLFVATGSLQLGDVADTRSGNTFSGGDFALQQSESRGSVKFVSVAKNNFRLAAGSAGHGSATRGPIIRDFYGKAWAAAPDAGAISSP